MPLPPDTIQVKRKRTDEPVDVLHIHETGKKQRLDSNAQYIFSRQPTEDTAKVPTSSHPAPEVVRRIKELHRTPSSQSLGVQSQTRSLPDTPQEQSGDAENVGSQSGNSTPGTNTSTPEILNAKLREHVAPQPRRFHISRPATPSGILDTPLHRQIRKRKYEPTVFVEKRNRPRNSDGKPVTDHKLKHLAAFVNPQPEHQPRKKPGLAARSLPARSTSPPKPSPAPLRNVRLPSGKIMPWDVNSEQLVAEMQAYTLQEIGKNLAESEVLRPEAIPTPAHAQKRPPSKFKPKVPALRYSERHPEEKVEPDTAMDMDESTLAEDVDESDYIIDTYIRIPATALESSSEVKNIGLLVLDSQPDIDEFYRESEDSDDEEEDEDEDENAENHYTADYPDEEVDSDDEYGLNSYRYRTRNTSDLEEYDDENDEDEGDLTYPGADITGANYRMVKRPWMQRPTGMEEMVHEGEIDSDY